MTFHTKKTSLLLAVIFAFTANAVFAEALRELAEKRNIHFGAAVNQRAFQSDEAYTAWLARECNIITAENAMKWSRLRPSQETYDFKAADAMVDFAEKNNMRVRGHTLVWHQMLPPWLTEGEWSRDELIALLREHIFTVATHYRGRVWAWDVVNEAVKDDASMRDSFWLKGIGPDYVEMAFRWAREADPDALLFYNDFVAEGGAKPSTVIHDYVQAMQAKGVPIDGVGLQLHLNAENPFRAWHLQQAVQRFAALNLEVHFTEIDVRLPLPATERMLNRQAWIYRNLMKITLEEPACTTMVLWGLTDKYSWVPNFFDGKGSALIIDPQYQPKPAYTALSKAFGQNF
jgi:endo-1,4-beta-xylanase